MHGERREDIPIAVAGVADLRRGVQDVRGVVELREQCVFGACVCHGVFAQILMMLRATQRRVRIGLRRHALAWLARGGACVELDLSVALGAGGNAPAGTLELILGSLRFVPTR